MWNITVLLFFIVLSCPGMVILSFLGIAPAGTPGRILTIYGLNDASLSPNDAPFAGFNDNPQF